MCAVKISFASVICFVINIPYAQHYSMCLYNVHPLFASISSHNIKKGVLQVGFTTVLQFSKEISMQHHGGKE